jgi:hypothetical protein
MCDNYLHSHAVPAGAIPCFSVWIIGFDCLRCPDQSTHVLGTDSKNAVFYTNGKEIVFNS